MGHAPQQHDIDPQALRDAERGWQAFGQASKLAVIAIAAILILMAAFLL
jgi:hypothetical protein